MTQTSRDASIRQFDSNMPDLDGKSILVTGGTGSFGSGFMKLVLTHHEPKRLIVFSRDELKQSELAQVLPPSRYPAIRYFIGDVRDRDRLEMAMRGVDYVIHAAALKQVPAAEYNPMECINTNVLGAENIVQAAIRTGVEKVIALSTDKATNPINLYGASKLAADKIFVAANNLGGADGPRFSVVRYGNVIGSRGSVVPLFQRMAAENVTELPITDPRMTRFWITLNQGVNFVLSSLAMMSGGEIYVPKIPSMGLKEMAEALVPGATHKIVGVRPGEKLHELLITADDANHTYDLGDRYVIAPAFTFWDADDRFEGMQSVGQDFAYASNTNDEWLDAESFRALCRDSLA